VTAVPDRGGRRASAEGRGVGRWQADPLALPNIRGKAVRLPPRLADASEDLDAARAWVRGAVADRKESPIAVDIFCGCGGLGLGLERAGMRVVAAADSDPVALDTYAANLESLTWCGDLGSPSDFLRFLADRGVTEVDVVAGGPPCQPFSRAGSSKIRSLVTGGVRPAKDGRVDLWRSFTEIVDELTPSAVLLENVPDMASWDDGSVLLGIMQSLNDRGYVTDARVLRAEQYGVPQHRQRLFVVARTRGTLAWPRPQQVRVDLEAAIGDLPKVPAGHRDIETSYGGPGSDFQIRARRGVAREHRNVVFDHVTRGVRQDDAEAFELLSPGQTYRDLPDRLKRYRDDIFSDKYKRLAWDDVSRTITAHIARDGYWYIHPDQTRTLSIREAARIQTFPDSFRFCGHPSVQLRQIGNAVPPALGEAMARRVLAALRSHVRAEPSRFAALLRAWAGGRADDRVVGVTSAHSAWAVVVAELGLGKEPADERSAQLRHALALAPDPTECVAAPERVRPLLGARRARRLVAAASAIVERHDGIVPRDEPSLRALPGIGAQTAALIRSFGYGESTVMASEGVRRVVERATGLRASSMWTVRVQLLRMAGPDGPDTSFNAALLDVVELCRPTRPLCADCPVASECRIGRRRVRRSQPAQRAA
jgi:DNA (cytosine-5)-methyltransferase 1